MKIRSGRGRLCVVSERKGRLIKNSQQELPKGVICLLDFIEQNEAEACLLSLVLIDRFLCQQGGVSAVSQVARACEPINFAIS